MSEPANGAVPPGYEEALYWTFSQNTSRGVIANLATLIVGLVFCCFCVGVLVPLVNPSEWSFDIPGLLKLISAVLLSIFGIVLMMPVQFLVQGILIRAFGAKPQIGIEWKSWVIYLTASGHAFKRTKYLMILVAPLVSLSLIFVMGIALLSGSIYMLPLALFAGFNAGASFPALWIFTIVLRYPASAYLITERDGIRVFVRNEGEIHV